MAYEVPINHLFRQADVHSIDRCTGLQQPFYRIFLSIRVRSAYSPGDTPARGKWITSGLLRRGREDRKNGPEKRSSQAISTYPLVGDFLLSSFVRKCKLAHSNQYLLREYI